MTQAALAQKTRMSREHLNRLEAGHSGRFYERCRLVLAVVGDQVSAPPAAPALTDSPELGLGIGRRVGHGATRREESRNLPSSSGVNREYNWS